MGLVKVRAAVSAPGGERYQKVWSVLALSCFSDCHWINIFQAWFCHLSALQPAGDCRDAVS